MDDKKVPRLLFNASAKIDQYRDRHGIIPTSTTGYEVIKLEKEFSNINRKYVKKKSLTPKEIEKLKQLNEKLNNLSLEALLE